MRRLIWALMLAATTAGCGADTLLQSPTDRRDEIAKAVAEALDAEKGWQTRFIERRTETMLAEQQATLARTQEIDNRTKALEDRLDDVARRLPSIADPGFGRAPGAVPTPAPATPPASIQTPPPTAELSAADRAEFVGLRRDLDAMTGAVAQLLTDRERADAAVRARFERLEFRTSKIGWPDEGDADRGVHLASYRSHDAALRGWEILQKRYRKALAAETPTFVEVKTVAGQFVRLFAGVGLPEKSLVAIRDAVRDGGDYAMVMPLPTADPGS